MYERCPNCKEDRLTPHCIGNEKCTWRKCPRCEIFGNPVTGRWLDRISK